MNIVVTQSELASCSCNHDMAMVGEMIVGLWEKLYVGAGGDHYRLYMTGEENQLLQL